MKVIKFGGTSIGTVENFNDVLKIILDRFKHSKTVVVISAITKITDKLLAATELAANKNTKYRKLFEEIESVHYEYLEKVVAKEFQEETTKAIEEILSNILLKLNSIYHLQEYSDRISDSLVVNGEYLSQLLLTAALKSKGVKAISVDSSRLIKTNSNYGQAEVNYPMSYKLIAAAFNKYDRDTIPIVNGFIGTTEEGNITTLGRSGSDYTATIIGNAINADTVEIWTDVDGILTADPRIVEQAISLNTLSYDDAAELAFLGAKVIFPKAMEPAKEKKIPVLILNTFQPEFKGTIITTESAEYSKTIKAVTHLENLSLITLSGIAIDSDVHLLQKIVTVLKEQNWPSISFNYSISQRSISILTQGKKALALLNEIKRSFKKEIEKEYIGKISISENLCLVSVIGNSNEHQTETMNRIYGTIEKNRFKNILFFSCSEGKNHSFLFAESKPQEVVNAIHDTFVNDFYKSVKN